MQSSRKELRRQRMASARTQILNPQYARNRRGANTACTNVVSASCAHRTTRRPVRSCNRGASTNRELPKHVVRRPGPSSVCAWSSRWCRTSSRGDTSYLCSLRVWRASTPHRAPRRRRRAQGQGGGTRWPLHPAAEGELRLTAAAPAASSAPPRVSFVRSWPPRARRRGGSISAVTGAHERVDPGCWRARVGEL